MAVGWSIGQQRQQTTLNSSTGGFEYVVVIPYTVFDKDLPGSPVILTATLEVPERLYTVDYVTQLIDQAAATAYAVSQVQR
jgi:hypothetical protein